MTRPVGLLRRVALGAALGVVVLGAGAYRTHRGAEEALAASEAAEAKGDSIGAILEAYRAATLRLPGDTRADDGVARLFDLAARAQARDDRTAAALAWRAVDASALATRGPFGPSEALRSRARKALEGAADGAANARTPSGKLATKSDSVAYDVRADARLENPTLPSPLRASAIAALVLLVLALAVPARRGAAPGPTAEKS